MFGSASERLNLLAEALFDKVKPGRTSSAERRGVEGKQGSRVERDEGKSRLWWLKQAEQVFGPLPVELIDNDARSILLSAPASRELGQSSTRARARKEKIFAYYDADNDGMLSFEELMHLAADIHAEFHPTACSLDQHALEQEVAEILRQIEVRQDHCVGRWNGTVEFDEFEPWLAEQEVTYLQRQPRPVAAGRASCLRFDALRSRMNLSRWRRIVKPFLPSPKAVANATAATKLQRSRSHDDLLLSGNETLESSQLRGVLVRSRSEDDLLTKESGRRGGLSATGEDKDSEDMQQRCCHLSACASPRARNADPHHRVGARLCTIEQHSRSEARSRSSSCKRAVTDQHQASRCAAVRHSPRDGASCPALVPSSTKTLETQSMRRTSPMLDTTTAPTNTGEALRVAVRDLVMCRGRASLMLAGRDDCHGRTRLRLPHSSARGISRVISRA